MSFRSTYGVRRDGRPIRVRESVPLKEAKRRALRALRPYLMDSLKSPAHVAEYIWPGHAMKPQGAGLAAVRILRMLEKEGLARWTHKTSHSGMANWGWYKTSKGEAHEASHSNP